LIGRGIFKGVFVKIYVVGAISKSHDITIMGQTSSLPLTWADGMVGVCPIFFDKEKALEYANGHIVLEYEAEEIKK
jgi:hypothetical protein